MTVVTRSMTVLNALDVLDSNWYDAAPLTAPQVNSRSLLSTLAALAGVDRLGVACATVNVPIDDHGPTLPSGSSLRARHEYPPAASAAVGVNAGSFDVVARTLLADGNDDSWPR